MIGAREAPLSEGSLWAATCRPADYPPLDGDAAADFVVIGAGFTGLSAALHLAEAGARVVCLDAMAPGRGASGRNGGQVIPGLKKGSDDGLTGDAARAADAAEGAADFLFDLIARRGLDCDAARGGWAHLAADERMLRKLEAKCESRRGRAGGLAMIDAAETGDRLGVSGYAGGLFDARAGVVHPLKLAAALARAATKAGARIHGGTRATAIEGEPGAMTVRTAQGAIRCRAVLTGPNGYADRVLEPARRSVAPVISIQVATEPLPAALRPAVMPGGVAASDIRRLTIYFRADAEGRLVIGGRGVFDAAANAPLFAALRETALRLFPQIAGRAVWRHEWGGRVAMTIDGLPRLAAPRPGVLTGLGYNGRGVAMAALMGRELALRARDRPEAECALPLTGLRRIPFHGLRAAGIAATIRAYRVMDRLGI